MFVVHDNVYMNRAVVVGQDNKGNDIVITFENSQAQVPAKYIAQFQNNPDYTILTTPAIVDSSNVVNQTASPLPAQVATQAVSATMATPKK